MPSFRKLHKRYETKSLSGGFGVSWADSGQGRTPWPALAKFDFQRAAGPLAENPTIAIGLSWVRRNVCKGRIVTGSESLGKYTESKRHPLTALLRRPNPWDSWRATLGGTSDSLKVDGNAYWVKARDGMGQVAEVYWIPNHCVEVVQELNLELAIQNGQIRGYWVMMSVGYRRWYLPSEVVHFRDGRDPLRRWMGIADLKRQLRNATSIVAAERFTAAVLMNAHSGKVIAPKEGEIEWMSDEAQGLVNSIQRGTSEENAGRLTKSNFPIDLLDVGLGPESMMLDRITDRPEAYLLGAMGLNGMTLNLPSSKDQATFANKGEARREAWENGIEPVQDLIADELEVQLLPDFPAPIADTVWWDRSDVSAVREDMNESATRAVMLRSCPVPIITQNEARDQVDLPPQAGGDADPAAEADAAQARATQAAADQGANDVANQNNINQGNSSNG